MTLLATAPLQALSAGATGAVAAAPPNAAVRECDLAVLIVAVAPQLNPQAASWKIIGEAASPVTRLPLPLAADPGAPVTRLRVLAALVKLLFSPAAIGSLGAEATLPDAAQIPAWGRPYVAAALQLRWWPENTPLSPQQPATWTFVETLLDRIPVVLGNGAIYTGLIVDARGLAAQRSMTPQILDTNGNVLYPDPQRVPGPVLLQEQGMANYVAAENGAWRSGGHPLVVRAIDVSKPSRERPYEGLVIANDVAEQIRAADRQGRFLARWAVSILITPHECDPRSPRHDGPPVGSPATRATNSVTQTGAPASR